MLRGIAISIQDYKGEENMFIFDETIEGNLELLLSPLYRDSVGTEELPCPGK